MSDIMENEEEVGRRCSEAKLRETAPDAETLVTSREMLTG